MLSLIFVIVLIISIQAEHNLVQHCGDFKAQQIVDIDMLLGKWYATELIYHVQEEFEINPFPNECPILFLEEVTKDRNIPGHHNYMDNENDRDSYHQNHQNMDNQEEILNWDEIMEPLLKVWKDQKKHGNKDFDDFKKQALHRLRLIWNGDKSRTEYSLRYNESRPGYWMSFGSQSDASYNQQHSYTPFIGTIQVLKAIRSQTILTFCHISQKHEFFTIVISREPWVNRTDLIHIHQMLERKQLPIRHIRRMCMEYRNSSEKIFSGMLLTILTISLVLFRSATNS